MEDLEEENQMFSFKGEEVIIQLEIRDTMKDLKLKRKISGLGGANCILCVSKQNDWTDPASIHEGFPITRESDETFRLFLKLVDKNGIVPRETGDFETRQGITMRPITTSSQKSITLTHAYINGTSWFIKLLTR